MKKLITFCTLLLAVAVNAGTNPPVKKAKIQAPKQPAYEFMQKRISNAVEKKVRVVTVWVNGVKAKGALIGFNAEKTKAEIMLDNKASRAADIAGTDSFKIRVDLGTFAKGSYSENKRAGKYLRSYNANDRHLYVYTFDVQPNGNFVKAAGNMERISKALACHLLK